MTLWRVGRKVALNVYDGDRPVCQCQTVEDAALIIEAVNAFLEQRQIGEWASIIAKHGEPQ